MNSEEKFSDRLHGCCHATTEHPESKQTSVEITQKNVLQRVLELFMRGSTFMKTNWSLGIMISCTGFSE